MRKAIYLIFKHAGVPATGPLFANTGSSRVRGYGWGVLTHVTLLVVSTNGNFPPQISGRCPLNAAFKDSEVSPDVIRQNAIYLGTIVLETEAVGLLTKKVGFGRRPKAICKTWIVPSSALVDKGI